MLCIENLDLNILSLCCSCIVLVFFYNNIFLKTYKHFMMCNFEMFIKFLKKILSKEVKFIAAIFSKSELLFPASTGTGSRR